VENSLFDRIVGQSGQVKESADKTVSPLAMLARDRARADEKAGHDAADYWRGWAAGAFVVGGDPNKPGYKKRKAKD